MAVRQATFIAQVVGYRCNFKNWVKNLGGKPNVVTQSRRTWSKLIVGIVRDNEYPKLVSKYWGLPKKSRSLEILILKLALFRGHGSHALQIFTRGSGL